MDILLTYNDAPLSVNSRRALEIVNRTVFNAYAGIEVRGLAVEMRDTEGTYNLYVEAKTYGGKRVRQSDIKEIIPFIRGVIYTLRAVD